jgi:hypothetical protein
MPAARTSTKWQCSDPLCAHVKCLEYAAYAQSENHETEMTVTRRPNDDVWDWSTSVKIDGESSTEAEARRLAEATARRLQAAAKA